MHSKRIGSAYFLLLHLFACMLTQAPTQASTTTTTAAPTTTTTAPPTTTTTAEPTTTTTASPTTTTTAAPTTTTTAPPATTTTNTASTASTVTVSPGSTNTASTASTITGVTETTANGTTAEPSTTTPEYDGPRNIFDCLPHLARFRFFRFWNCLIEVFRYRRDRRRLGRLSFTDMLRLQRVNSRKGNKAAAKYLNNLLKRD